MTDDLESIQAAIDAGDADAAEKLLPLVYEELRKLAHHHMQREAPGNSLQTTILVHEAYLRLLGPQNQGQVGWEGRGHFFAAAAQAMRRILVDRARARGRDKRGGQHRRVDMLDLANLSVDEVPPEVIELDEALTRLAAEAPAQAELVSLRFFSGLTLKQAAAVLGISSTTADRHWAYARAWLRAALQGDL